MTALEQAQEQLRVAEVALAAAREQLAAAATDQQQQLPINLPSPASLRQKRRYMKRKAIAAATGVPVSKVRIREHAHGPSAPIRYAGAPRALNCEKASKHEAKNKAASAAAPRRRVPRVTWAKLFKSFKALVERETEREYPILPRAPWPERKAAMAMLADHAVDELLRAAHQLAHERRRSDWDRQHRPLTLAYLRWHVVELLQRADAPARPRPRAAATDSGPPGGRTAAYAGAGELAVGCPDPSPPLALASRDPDWPPASSREEAAARLAAIHEGLRARGHA